jgi:hypothetical protein
MADLRDTSQGRRAERSKRLGNRPGVYGGVGRGGLLPVRLGRIWPQRDWWRRGFLDRGLADAALRSRL